VGKTKKKLKTDMLRSIGKQSGESVESVLKRKKATVKRKKKVLSLGYKSEKVMKY